MSTSNRMTPQEISKQMRKKSQTIVENTDTDFLDADRPIPGQNFVCLSFLSPEAAIKERYLTYVKKFLEDLTAEIPQPDGMPNVEFKTKLQQIVTNKVTNKGISNLWEDFIYNNSEKLDKDYNDENDFQTSVRGLKIRGTYDSHREAKRRADQVAKFDKNHNVYIGQVGYWLPWDPDPHEVPEQEYQQKELNTLMKKYRENMMSKDQFFEERNREKMEAALKKNKNAKKVDEKVEKELEKVRKTINEKDKILNDAMEESRKAKAEQKVEEKGDVPDGTPENENPSVSSEKDDEKVTSSGLGTSEIDGGSGNTEGKITDVFNTDDPWLQRKNGSTQ